MALGERVMVLEGLRMSRTPRYAQAVGAGGAGGKGIASLSGLGDYANYTSIDCDTCLSVAEYEALAAQRRRLANRAITMQASAWRRAAQGGREARMDAEDAIVAAAAAKALAANADAKAMIARQLQTAPANVAHRLVDAIKALANRSAAILKSDRSEWLPGAGGYAAAVGPFSRPRKALSGLSGAWIMGPDGKYVWDEGTASTTAWGGKDISAGSLLPPGTTGIVDLEAQRSAQDAYLAGDYSGTGALEYFKADVTLNQRDQGTYDIAVRTGVSPYSILANVGGRAADSYQISVGGLPFKVTSTQEFYYNRNRRELRVTRNNPSFIKRGLDAAAAAAEGLLDAAADAAGGLAKQAVCFAAKKAAAAAMAALHCGDPPYADTIDCRAGAAAQAEILRRAGCTPPKEIKDAAAGAPSASKFGGAVTIAIPALLAVLLLGGK